MATDIINNLLIWVSNNPNYSYLLIFLISLSESLVVVGLVVPGLTIMLAIGTMIGIGYISLWPAMITAILGAVAGDAISYQIGRHYQQSIRDWYIFRKYPDVILRCEKFFARHGKKSVVIGRFAGPVRPMIPAIAGMMKMPQLQFYTVNIISALLWAPSHLIPGIIFGNTLQTLPAGIGKKLTAIVFLALIIFWFTSIIVKNIWRGLKHRFNRWGSRIWFYAENNSLTFLQKIISHPLTHKKHQVDSFLFLILALSVTILFIVFTKLHFFTTALNPFFKHLALLLNTSPILNHILLIIDSNVSELLLIIIFLGYFIYFAINNSFNHQRVNTTIFNKQFIINRPIYISSGLLLAFFATTYFVSYIVKYPAPYQLASTYSNLYRTSFPNVSIGLLALLIGYIGIIKYSNDPKEFVKSSYNFLAGCILILFILIKLYLGQVWLSDILGAILLSCCLLLIFCIFYWQKPIENINKKQFNIASCFIIFTICFVNTCIVYLSNIKPDYNLATVHQNLDTEDLDFEAWHTQDNLFSSTSDPVINIQWLGDIENIQLVLQENLWQSQPAFGFKSILNHLENDPKISNLPITPAYYQDHPPVITYSRQEQNNKILVIRLWQSPYFINNKTLWVGTVEYFKPQKLFDTLVVLKHWPQREFSDAIDNFTKILNPKQKQLNSKIITISDQTLADDDLKILLLN